jgi:Recombination endonuclease VII
VPRGYKMVSPPGHKWCPHCKQHKTVENFPRNRSSKDGVAGYCKPFHNRISRANREKHHGSTRNFHLKRRYGIDGVTVEWLILQQAGLCALCLAGTPEHVDHDHSTGSVRGILCFNCNRGISKFAEDTDVMKRAVEYLKSTEPVR